MNSFRSFKFLLLRSSFPKKNGEEFSSLEQSFLILLEKTLQGSGRAVTQSFPAEEYPSYTDVRRELPPPPEDTSDAAVLVLWAFEEAVLTVRRELNNIEHVREGYKHFPRIILITEGRWYQELNLWGQDSTLRMMRFEPTSIGGSEALCMPLRRKYTEDDIDLLAGYLGIERRRSSREDDSTRDMNPHHDATRRFDL
ncbi:hypothetical protein COX00_01405 [Candidatus Uhrbacteria bacterium CG22_combo_CG10-13_8_21_14_all_47_17]|uniref:Uncharacterized protein n=1 Tax=Candidatus Uhrbacteria bacterium CG22_combo_CG10-13_8_21_14_all_47_17 TaxID=1975041 RepID=A0A2H0BT10_9BACT|nr:MAG: hypothetical protein COX00_01405 [Candidatus Uhrbacteria bacterium CG22_combo_CG10-13_8_21_14_all_47_17]